MENGRKFRGGELRFLPVRQRYQFTATTPNGKKLVFEGQLKDEILTLERVGAASKETQRLVINVADDGARFIYRYERRPAGRTVFVRDFQVVCTKEDESLAAKEQKLECVASAGLGKIRVDYKGTAYSVCCTGCRGAFLENPEKYIKEYEAKKARRR